MINKSERKGIYNYNIGDIVSITRVFQFMPSVSGSYRETIGIVLHKPTLGIITGAVWKYTGRYLPETYYEEGILIERKAQLFWKINIGLLNKPYLSKEPYIIKEQRSTDIMAFPVLSKQNLLKDKDHNS